MPTKKSPFYGAATLALGLALIGSPAHAGFEWVAPAADNAPMQPMPAPVIVSPQPPASPLTVAPPDIISPVIITGDSKPAAAPQSYNDNSNYAASAPVPLTPSAQPQPPSNNLATATISMSPPPAASAAPGPLGMGGDIVQGFATDVPLPLALRQLLPAGYNFSIDQDIAVDTPVSYKGGRPWRDTLKNMLATVGLVMEEQGSSISVSRNPALAAPLATTTPPPQPAASSAPAPMAATIPLTPAPAAADAPQSLMPPPPAHVLKAPASMMQPAPMTASTSNMMPAASSDLPAMNVGNPDGWTASRGDTLRKVLTDWCRRANIELQWQAEYDYPVEASAHFNGSFEDATRSLLAGFDGARPQPIGELHDSPTAGQMVLVIQARGNSYTN